MSQRTRDYDSTVARIAGNIIGHLLFREHDGQRSWGAEPQRQEIEQAVATARAIVAETKRTEPKPDEERTR